jgi:hypothetical protein
MVAYHSGLDISFMTKDSSAIVHPVAFGGQQCRGNKVRLHSHLGEVFAGNWATSTYCSGNALCGLQIAMQSVSSCPTMAITWPFQDSR